MSALIKECVAEIRKTVRAPAFIIPTLLFPVLFYSVFGILVSSGGTEQATYLVATYGIFAAMGPALFGFGVGVALEREKGWLDLKRVMPMSPTYYLLAKLTAAMVSAAAAILLIYSVAITLGGVELSIVQWGKLFLTHLVTTVPFGVIGLTVGLLLKGQAAIAITNVLNLGLALLGGLWVPLQFFPAAMQSIAQFLPSFHAGQIALSVVGAVEADFLNAAIVMAVFTGVFGATALLSWGHQRH